MKKYYTRACNFFYGSVSKKLVKKKFALPLCGSSLISFNQIEIFAKDKKHVWTFSSYDSDAAVFSDRNCFPRSIIIKMEKITL